ncbi:glycoside hydrolase family 127 protein [Tessaracoccus sp.]|uniref:glycoside hydrolase family 127 protein n=1 Tax=Tessaracoccus sp. TaxID=1971211 RepID=UPI00262157B9|nr:beta-L-arabinofuranosidase domain-containing protein [Tessaracoccus sp.]
MPNFDLAASGAPAALRRGREFSDSEVYKYLEAVAWEIGRGGATDLEDQFRRTVARVAAAQGADGYLNTNFGRPDQRPRWSDLEWGHELYCAGHLFQAAVARERTRPGADDGLLGVACRFADLVCDVFADGGIESVCGHAEVEVGLAELARVTGSERYAAMARTFVERRGGQSLRDIEFGRSYFQDDVPVREAEVLRGHAVRANYLAAGAVDVAVDGDDAGLLDALRRQWVRTVAARTYITGGQGAHHQDEAFGDDFELPPDRAYSETCAGIGSIMFAWRLLLADGDEKYADLIERTLFNVVATSPSADGRAFYYADTLHQRVARQPADPEATSPRASASLRAPWFDVSCCPPNVARTLASLDAYVATADTDGVQLHQYAPAGVRTTLHDGRVVRFDVETDYPASGRVRILFPEDSSEPWTLGLRIPAWADGAELRDPDGVVTRVAPGRAEVRRAFRAGDEVVLDLPVAPRVTFPDPRIDAVRGCVAIERGPEVLALESVDLPGDGDVADIAVAGEPVEHGGRVWMKARELDSRAAAWPYASTEPGAARDVGEVALVPYHSWANRGPSTMRVWLPVADRAR